MTQIVSKRKFVFVVPTLSELAAQNEDVVQLLLFAATRLAQEVSERPDRGFAATIISIEPNTRGWKHLSSLFSEEVLEHISLEELKEPATPNLAIASHKPAYHLFEYLKTCVSDEVHCLDRNGLLYYPTQAKQLGLYFLNIVFVVHIVGGTIFRHEAEDALLDNVSDLMDDLLERGSLERADVVYVHDHKAWAWYADKVEMHSGVKVYDLSWPQSTLRMPVSMLTEADTPAVILYYGALSADGGLPVFCNAIDRVFTKLEKPVEVFFVGSPHAIGGMDAVSYIRLRSAKWGVPVTIKREFSILDEITFLFNLSGIIVCNRVRREGLRTRLIAGSGLPVLQVEQQMDDHPEKDGKVCSANPNHMAELLMEMLASAAIKPPQQPSGLTELWCAARPPPANLEDIAPSASLEILHEGGPRVSVCITHFCRPQKLRAALASLKAQTYQNFEVIVIDDGSPDPKVQRELAKIRQEIQPLGWRLLVQENRYLGAARNYGASQANGDYLLFMDDDNVAMPREISTLVAVALRTGSDIVTSFFDAFETEDTLTSSAPSPLRLTPFGSDPTLGILTNCYGDANALYSRTIFYKLGGFTEDYGITHEDWEFFCRASLEGAKLVCVPEPLFWYRVDQRGMYRGQATQLHKNANLRRHIRPYLAKLPYDQAKLVQLVQGLTTELPVVTVGANTRTAGPRLLRAKGEWLPYARVAVIMRTKDRPFLLRRAVRSVLEQTFKDWLLVIVNDGGKPEGVELVLDEVAEELVGRVLVLHHPTPLGMQTAANAGISRCDSDFIVIHDDDDSWEPTFLARTVSHLDENGWNPRVGGVVTWSYVIVEELNAEGEIKAHNQFVFDDKLRTIALLDLAIENRFPPISFLFHRAALDVVGSFKEQYGVLGDWEFHLRLLRQYDIAVIPEPLANYHHRTQTTAGVYSNSVHAQTDLHRSKRIDLHNDVLREDLARNNGISLAQLLALGNLQKTIAEQQGSEFQRLHNYLWTIEQRVNYISSQVYAANTAKRGRNLVRNGDFRLWPGPGAAIKGPGEQYAFAAICPGFVLCYDGRHVSYRVALHKWTADGQKLPFGKSYLHIENDGRTKNGTWFMLECIIPSALWLSGQKICISGLGRLAGSQRWIRVGGRYDLGDGRQVVYPDQFVALPSEFAHWSCSISCPSIQETELTRGHQARILLKLPFDQPFEFDLTDFQVELGAVPTPFEYNATLSLLERLSVLWSTVKTHALFV